MSKFIVLEGVDGCGKSTQARILVDYLNNNGVEAILTAEPSTGFVGDIIKGVFNGDDENKKLALPWLFAADRAMHLRDVIEPALARGCVVVSDRYFHSSEVYQSDIMPFHRIVQLNSTFRIPDVTFFLKTSCDVCFDRLLSRGDTSMSKNTILALSTRYMAVMSHLRSVACHNIVTIDGDEDPGSISNKINKIAMDWLDLS